MKFIYTAGDYTTRDGVTFLFRNPTTVENRTTIEKLLKDPAFSRYEESRTEPGQTGPVGAEETITITKGASCPKCGRVIRQGMFMHEKYCKGLA